MAKAAQVMHECLDPSGWLDPSTLIHPPSWLLLPEQLCSYLWMFVRGVCVCGERCRSNIVFGMRVGLVVSALFCFCQALRG